MYQCPRPATWSLLISALISYSLGCKSSAVGKSETAAARPGYFERIGVQTWSVRKELKADQEGTLRALHTMGFRELELHTLFDMPAVKTRRYLESLGFTARALHVSYDRLAQDAPAIVADARALGVRYVVVPWIPHEEGAGYTVADNEAAIALFARVGRLFQEAGIRFAYHPHGYEFHDGGTGRPLLDQMIERLPAGVVDFEMDVYWVVHAGADPVDYVKRFPGRFILFHMKDMQAGTETGRTDGKSDPDAQVTLGTGIIDFPALVAEAERQGAHYYFIEDESSRSMEQMPESLKYLRSLGAAR